jgi:hypothetical protein
LRGVTSLSTATPWADPLACALGACSRSRRAKQDRYFVQGSDWRIRVQGVDDDWAPNGEPTLCRPGTLQYPERAIRLRIEDVPAALFAMLMKATASADVL